MHAVDVTYLVQKSVWRPHCGLASSPSILAIAMLGLTHGMWTGQNKGLANAGSFARTAARASVAT